MRTFSASALAEARTRAGMSRDDLAAALGLSCHAVKSWEWSQRYPRGQRLAQLADVLDCSIERFFVREGSRDA